jgi:bromodomain adjacent to zinc finger domain protein 1A
VSFITCTSIGVDSLAPRAPLKLSSFTLDELENAIRHSDPDQPVTLIAEIHSSLIYALRALSTHRHLAVLSLLDELDNKELNNGVATEILTDALAEIGNNWERQPLRVDEGRFGWEEALVGCIKDVSQYQRPVCCVLCLIILCAVSKQR